MDQVETIWHKYENDLRKYVKKRISDAGVVEDILQEAFLRAHRNLNGSKKIDNAEGWIYRIITNLIIDHYRSSKQYESLPPEYVAPEEKKTPSSELSECINLHIQSLPEIYRTALVLSELEGYTHKKVAEHLGISLSAAKSRIRRGKEKLKQRYLDCCKIEMRSSIVDYTPHDDESN